MSQVDFVNNAQKDPLTGLLSGEAIFAVLHELSTTFTLDVDAEQSVLFVDVDYLKQYNDTLGRPQGDQLLINIAAAISRELPPTSQIGRIGGDEFLVVLPSTGLSAAIEVAKHLRRVVEQDFGHSSVSYPITLTIGVATTPKNMSWISEELIALAESRMIVGKKRFSPSRNVVWAGDMPADWHKHWEAFWPSTGPFIPKNL
jgi:diguanylate cyclase (GGDEF)-like protein